MLKLVYSFLVSEIEEFRTGILKLLLAFAGMSLLFVGWTATREVSLLFKHRLMFSIGIAIIVILGLFITHIIKRYFSDTASAISRIDEISGMYEKGLFMPNETILPSHWRDFGKDNWKEPIFTAAYVGITVIGVFASAAVWLI